MKNSHVCTLFLCITVCILICVLLLFYISHVPPYFVRGKADKDKPYYFEFKKEPCAQISEILVQADYLYVLYDEISVLSCYKTDGIYLHSYLFDMGTKGQAHLHLVDEMLLMESKDHSFYRLEDGKFAFYYKSEEDLASNNLAIDATNGSGNIYEDSEGGVIKRKGASIWKYSNNGEEYEIISRPAWYVLFQYDIVFLGMYAACLVTIYFLWNKILLPMKRY